jgi:hypothetical protein
LAATETIITFTVTPSTIPPGREITIIPAGLPSPSAQLTNGTSAGTIAISGAAFSFATTGDQIFAYQGPDNVPTTFISGMHMNVEAGTTAASWDPAYIGNATSVKPATLTTDVNAIWINPEQDNAKFINCAGSLNNAVNVRATVNNYLANPGYWTVYNQIAGELPPFNLPTGCAYMGLAPLPVSLVSFTGKLNSDKTITLQWKVEAQQDMQEYIVEESTDGSTYRQLGSVPAGTGNTDTYSYTDMQVATGNNYYRLKTVELSGKIAYSDVVVVNLKSGIKVSVYPNPVTDKLTIQQFGTIQNKTAVLLDGEGKTLQQIKLTNLQQEVSIKAYPAGIYIVKMEDGTVFKIVKQ